MVDPYPAGENSHGRSSSRGILMGGGAHEEPKGHVMAGEQDSHSRSSSWGILMGGGTSEEPRMAR